VKRSKLATRAVARKQEPAAPTIEGAVCLNDRFSRHTLHPGGARPNLVFQGRHVAHHNNRDAMDMTLKFTQNERAVSSVPVNSK
jgi:hypothetical protein